MERWKIRELAIEERADELMESDDFIHDLIETQDSRDLIIELVRSALNGTITFPGNEIDFDARKLKDLAFEKASEQAEKELEKEAEETAMFANVSEEDLASWRRSIGA